MKRILLILLASVLLTACSKPKVFKLGNRSRYDEFKPYGWMDYNEHKNDSIEYEVNIADVVWSVVLSETVVAPILITGLDIMEPVRIKPQFLKKNLNI